MVNVCVYGMGYIGLPTAAIIADTGLQVLGVDLNESLTIGINQGVIPHHNEDGLGRLVSSAVASGRLRADTRCASAEVHIIAVGTPVGRNKEPDLSQVIAATHAVAEVIRPGDLVILESTVPPGTCESLIGKLLRELTGLDHTCDYCLAHCPERVLPGRLLHELVYNDRIIGGTTPEATRRAIDFYERFVRGELLGTSATTAELCKLMENTFRDVNIALANVLADVAKVFGVQIDEAIAICNRHPRVNIHSPGIGVGGHCIPVDPWFLINADIEATGLLRVAREVNDRRPSQVADAIVRAVLEGSYRNVALLGLSYKPDVDDMRDSPAILIARHVVQALPYPVMLVEPHIDSLSDDDLRIGGASLVSLDTALKSADILVRLVPHRQFSELETHAATSRLLDISDLIGSTPRARVQGEAR